MKQERDVGEAGTKITVEIKSWEQLENLQPETGMKCIFERERNGASRAKRLQRATSKGFKRLAICFLFALHVGFDFIFSYLQLPE